MHDCTPQTVVMNEVAVTLRVNLFGHGQRTALLAPMTLWLEERKDVCSNIIETYLQTD